jgi:murein endopeptidase
VDLGYPQKLRKGEELGWRKITADNVAPEETWTLLKILVETGAVEVVIMDRKIQKMLYDHAVKHGTVTKRQLRRWLEYPRDAGSGGALVVHAPRHDDHIHVRFACPKEQTRCKTRGSGPRG